MSLIIGGIAAQCDGINTVDIIDKSVSVAIGNVGGFVGINPQIINQILMREADPGVDDTDNNRICITANFPAWAIAERRSLDHRATLHWPMGDCLADLSHPALPVEM